MTGALTIPVVRSWRPQHLVDAGRELEDVAHRLERVARSTDDAVQPALGKWHGIASKKAARKTDEHVKTGVQVADAINETGKALAHGGNALIDARSHLLDAVADATDQGFQVSDDGTVTEAKALAAETLTMTSPLTPEGVAAMHAAQHELAEAAHLQQRIQEALEDVRHIDQQTAAKLNGVALPPDVAAAAAKLIGSFLPSKGSIAVKDQHSDASAVVSFGVFRGSADETYDYVEYADGHVEVTMTNTGSLGLGTDDGSVDGQSGTGSVWEVSGPNALAKAHQMMAHMWKTTYPSGAQTNTGTMTTVRVGPAPDKTMQSVGLSADGHLDLDGVAHLDGSASDVKTVVHDHNTDSTTVTYNADGTLGGGAEQGAAGGADHSGGQQLSVTRDADGNLTNVTVVKTSTNDVGAGTGVNAEAGEDGKIGGGYSAQHHHVSTTQTTSSLDLSDPHQRALVDQYLKDRSGGSSEAGAQLSKLVHDHGVVTQTRFEGSGKSFDIDGSYGEVGTSAHQETTNTHATHVQYLDLPDSHGHRRWVSMRPNA